MDPVTYGAAVAAPFSDAEYARRWFELITEQLLELGEDVAFEDAMNAIRQHADADGIVWAADALTEYLQANASEPVAVLRALADPDHEQEYVEASCAAALQASGEGAVEGGDATADDGESAASAEDLPFDETAWGEYLGRWQGAWDGTDEAWPAFKESFLYWAPDGTRTAAQQLVGSAEASGLVDVLMPYGIVAPGEAAPAEAAGAEAAGADAAPVVAADAVIASVLQDRPDLAALGDERLQELFAEVMAELDTGDRPVSG
jgi:hypothetical protein